MHRLTVHGRALTLTICLLGAGAAALVLGGPGGRAASASADHGLHLVVVPASSIAQAALAGTAARTVARYEEFTLVEATGADTDRLVAAGADVRDDMRTVRIGTRSSDPAVARPSLLDKTGAARTLAGKGSRGLAVVQYVGPLKDAWVKSVVKSGVEVVTYMAQNGQLVSGDDAALAALAQLSSKHAFIRAVTPYTAADKRLPGLRAAGRSEVVVTTVAGAAGAAARAAVERVSQRRGSDVPVGRLVQQRVNLDGADLAALAAHGGVVALQPFTPPELLDERAAQIVAGNLNATFQPVLGSGYRSFLTSRGFPIDSLVTVDITDSGVDKGVHPAPAGSHTDFYRSHTAFSRIRYAQEASSADVDARDCGGHGTNVASIATGYNAQTGAAVEDAQGFNYGLGIHPFGRLGITKIFNCANAFDVSTSLTALHSAAYGSGARISNNSWGTTSPSSFGGYDAFAQEMDALVRDAQPGVAGNQPITEVMSAGNAGSGADTIGSPGTGKNVITVGASESVRPIGGSDGCGVPDAGANSARDIIDFSSRGPTNDGRTKPDIVAPGTHVAGAQPQSTPYTGAGTCNPSFPLASTLYSLVSGTSQAAPEVSGAASVIHDYFRRTFGGGTSYPSPAMTKAFLVNTAKTVVGGNDGTVGGTNGHVPTQTQGWGRANLGGVLDGAARQTIDQSNIFGATGGAASRVYTVAAAARPLRVTLAWTDPPGPTTGNSFVNDLDLEVTVGGTTYKGNVFSGGRSVAGGVADPRNNVENVFLPAGATGGVRVRVVAKNIAGDGVPGNADTTDQDYALVVSNVGAPTSTPVLEPTDRTFTIAGDGDAVLEPGEPFTVTQRLRNVGNAAATAISGTMTAPASDATVTQGSTNWPNLGPGASAFSSPPFGATVKSTLSCGDNVDLTIHVASSAGQFNVPVQRRTGAPAAAVTTHNSTDVPKAIPDNNPAGVTSNLAMPGPGRVADLNVKIGSLTHTWVSDLEIDLVSPAGTVVRLFNRHGGSGDNLVNTVFDDEASASITTAAPPFTGSFKPYMPLSAFDGQPTAGTWKLIVRDRVAADTGTLNSWSVLRRLFSCS